MSGDIGNAGDVSGFGIAQGEGDIGAASGFDQALLSGNQAEEAKLLAPQISNIQKQGQQQIKTAGEFGDRSGGTNAAAQTNIDSQRANVSDMIAKLTGGAASDLGSLGTSTLGLGLSANEQQAQEAEQKLKNQQDSLLGGTITGGVGDLLESAASFLPTGG